MFTVHLSSETRHIDPIVFHIANCNSDKNLSQQNYVCRFQIRTFLTVGFGHEAWY